MVTHEVKRTTMGTGMRIGIVALGLGLAGCQSLCRMGGTCPPEGKMSRMKGDMACAKCGVKKGLCACGVKGKSVATVNTAALKALVDAGVPMTLVDARTGTFDDGRRIAGALSLSPEAPEAEILGTLKSKDALIVTYCANLQCPASHALAIRLTALGYTRVVEYPNGIDGWVGEGNAVIDAAGP